MSKLRDSFPIVLGILTIGIIIGIVFTTGLNIDNKGYAGLLDKDKIYTESRSDQPVLNAGNFNPNQMFVDIVKQTKPAIVSISTTKNIKQRVNPFYHFFRDFEAPEGQEQEFKQQGLGSGIIINSNGYILTNHHVVKDTDQLTVELTDGRQFEGEIIGTDATTEIALVKIEAGDLPYAKLGNSDHVEIGEWVIAIGNPMNLSYTVTAGIVSALSRNINIIRDQETLYGIENFIQTDAAINPGNSGGALVNMHGEVIGVNTAIASQTGSYVGYGFAVPINIAKNVIDDLMEYGEIRRGYLGVYIEPMNPVKAKGLGLDKPQGVLVTSVIDGKAAQKAGIMQGDVILQVNGKPVNKTNELQAQISTFDPGEKVELLVWRDGRKKNITAVLEGLDGEAVSAAVPDKKEEQRMQEVGLQIRDMENSELQKLDLDYGVLILNVNNYSTAQKAGLFPREVIYEIDGKKVDSVSMLVKYINERESGDVVRMKVRRKDSNNANFDRLIFMEIPK